MLYAGAKGQTQLYDLVVLPTTQMDIAYSHFTGKKTEQKRQLTYAKVIQAPNSETPVRTPKSTLASTVHTDTHKRQKARGVKTYIWATLHD